MLKLRCCWSTSPPFEVHDLVYCFHSSHGCLARAQRGAALGPGMGKYSKWMVKNSKHVQLCESVGIHLVMISRCFPEKDTSTGTNLGTLGSLGLKPQQDAPRTRYESSISARQPRGSQRIPQNPRGITFWNSRLYSFGIFGFVHSLAIKTLRDLLLDHLPGL